MKKIIIIICMLLAFPAVFAAENEVEVVIPDFVVELNGIQYDSSEALYPMINYKGITYFPMTWNLSRGLGLTTTYSNEEGLGINKSSDKIDLTYTKGGNNASGTYKAALPNYKIMINGTEISNETEAYPILNFRSVTYFPLTWRFAVEEFNWDYTYSAESGLAIGAKEDPNTIQKDSDDYTVASDGIVTIEKTYYESDLKATESILDKFTGLADRETTVVGYIFPHKNHAFNGYYYDSSYAFYDVNDELIRTMLYFGDYYKSVEGGRGDKSYNLYGEPKEYHHVVMTVTMYPPAVYDSMNQSIVKDIDMEYVSIDDISKTLLESEGAYYFDASYYGGQDPKQALYGGVNSKKSILMPDGKYYRTGSGSEDTLVPYDDDNYNLPVVSELGKITHESGNSLISNGPSFKNGVGQYYVMTLYDKNFKPFKLLVNPDEFK